MTRLKTALIYGTIAGLILNSTWWIFNSLFMDMENYDMSKGEIAGYTSMIVAFSAVYFGVKKYRDGLNDDTFSFGKAFLVGLYITLVASSVYVIGWMFYSDLMMPDFAEQYMNSQLAAMKEAGASLQEMEASRAEHESFGEMYKNPFLKALFTLVEPLPIGLFASLVSAFLLKRK